jgi:hypothetical protein
MATGRPSAEAEGLQEGPECKVELSAKADALPGPTAEVL